MKKLLLPLLLQAMVVHSYAQSCTGGLLVNDHFSSGLANWSQYGSVSTAIALPITNACIDTCLALPATNNGTTGAEQLVTIQRDSCYDLCYCFEFPNSGSLFNAKLLIAFITPGITPGMLLTGSFTPAQAQIIDSISSNVAIPPTPTCIPPFQATGNFTSLVIINKTTGTAGTDIRVDNVCLMRHACVYTPSCDSVNAGFTYTVSGNTVTFTDVSTMNPGDVPSWTWTFGDPPSGNNDTSILQNPSHVYPGPGIYFVCLYFTTVTTSGLTCTDTFCRDVIVPGPVGFADYQNSSLVVVPNPASQYLQFRGTATASKIILFDAIGQQAFETVVKDDAIALPATLARGIYYALIQTDKGKLYRKLIIEK